MSDENKIASIEKFRTLKALGIIEPEIADAICGLEKEMVSLVKENATLEAERDELAKNYGRIEESHGQLVDECDELRKDELKAKAKMAGYVSTLEAGIGELKKAVEDARDFIGDGSACEGKHDSEADRGACEECCFLALLPQWPRSKPRRRT